MTRGVLIVALLAAAARSQEGVFVDVTAPKRAYFVHEPIPLRLRLGFDRETFRRHAVPLFPQDMEVPVEVRAPWLDGLEGAEALPAPAPGAGPRLRFVLNDAIVAAEATVEVRGDRTWTILTVDRRFVARAPCTLAVRAPTMRYVHATRFRDDFLQGRRAEDPRDVRVAGGPLEIEVRPPPPEGRPASYVDAVGHFTMRAAADRHGVAEGEPFRLTLRIGGEGNLETLTPPSLRDLAGFHVYAVTDDRGRPVRTLVFEMAALPGAAVDAVPPIPLCYLDPGEPPAYRFAFTDPVALEVERAPAEGAGTGGSGGRRALWLALGLVLGAAASAVAVTLWRRARAASRADPAAARARAAAAAFHRAASAPAADLADAFTAYLAAHLRCAPAAVVAPDLAARLQAAGAPRELAERAATALRARVEARYGGTAPRDDLAALVGDLEKAFRPADA